MEETLTVKPEEIIEPQIKTIIILEDELEKKIDEFDLPSTPIYDLQNEPQFQEIMEEKIKKVVETRPYTQMALSAGTIVASTAAAIAVNTIPLSFTEAVLLLPVQSGMLVTLSVIWDVPLDVIPIKTIIIAVGLSCAQTVGISVTSLLKFMPGVGTVSAGIINGTVSALSTCTLGVVVSIIFSVIYEIKGNCPASKELFEVNCKIEK
eukprot:gene9739-2066_t